MLAILFTAEADDGKLNIIYWSRHIETPHIDTCCGHKLSPRDLVCTQCGKESELKKAEPDIAIRHEGNTIYFPMRQEALPCFKTEEEGSREEFHIEQGPRIARQLDKSEYTNAAGNAFCPSCNERIFESQNPICPSCGIDLSSPISFDYVIYMPKDLKDLKGFVIDIYGGGIYQWYCDSDLVKYRKLAHKGLGVITVNLSDLELPFKKGQSGLLSEANDQSLMAKQYNFFPNQINILLKDIEHLRKELPNVLHQTLSKFSEEQRARIAPSADKLGVPIALFGPSYGGFLTLDYAASGRMPFDYYIALSTGAGHAASQQLTPDMLKKIAQPTLIFQGEFDARTPPGRLAGIIEQFSQEQPGQEFIHIKRLYGGHDGCANWLSFFDGKETLSEKEQRKKDEINGRSAECQQLLVDTIFDFVTHPPQAPDMAGQQLDIQKLYKKDRVYRDFQDKENTEQRLMRFLTKEYGMSEKREPLLRDIGVVLGQWDTFVNTCLAWWVTYYKEHASYRGDYSWNNARQFILDDKKIEDTTELEGIENTYDAQNAWLIDKIKPVFEPVDIPMIASLKPHIHYLLPSPEVGAYDEEEKKGFAQKVHTAFDDMRQAFIAFQENPNPTKPLPK